MGVALGFALSSVGKGYAARWQSATMAIVITRVVKRWECCLRYSISSVFLYLLRVAAKMAAHIILLALTVE